MTTRSDLGVDAGPADAELIERSVREPAVFAAVFDRHADRVHRYLSRRAGPGVADDLVGETFLAAFEQRAQFDPARSPAGALPWLLGIATNMLRGHRRAEQRRWQVLERAAAAPPTPGPPVTDGVEARVDAGALVGALMQTLAALPAGDRNVLLLYAWAELSYEDIAAALQIPVGTVRSRLNRVRTRLRTAAAALPNHTPRSDDDG